MDLESSVLTELPPSTAISLAERFQLPSDESELLPPPLKRMRFWHYHSTNQTYERHPDSWSKSFSGSNTSSNIVYSLSQPLPQTRNLIYRHQPHSSEPQWSRRTSNNTISFLDETTHPWTRKSPLRTSSTKTYCSNSSTYTSHLVERSTPNRAISNHVGPQPIPSASGNLHCCVSSHYLHSDPPLQHCKN